MHHSVAKVVLKGMIRYGAATNYFEYVKSEGLLGPRLAANNALVV